MTISDMSMHSHHARRANLPRARVRFVSTVMVSTVIGLLGWFSSAGAQSPDVTLDEMSYVTLPGDRVRIKLQLSGEAKQPNVFAIDNPARIALDLPGVGINLPKKTEKIGVGMARSVAAAGVNGRTRVVLNLIQLVPYELQVEGQAIYVTLGSAAAEDTVAESYRRAAATRGVIESIDFRRGEAGEGRLIVKLSDPSVVADTREEGGHIFVDFLNTSLPDQLARRLDVGDFATPVQEIDAFKQGNGVRMVISANGFYEHLTYQSDDIFTVDIKPVSKQEEEAVKKERFGYTGERLSLNFQSIEVRAVLQLIADFTGLNLVASDTVNGNLTLRLKNVPWDQALAIILKTKGLGMRQAGNVILVAPSEEIAAREKLELEAQKQITELAPLHTEFMQVNYAKASELATLLKADSESLLSERGNVTVDDRTNTLLVRDTRANLGRIRELVSTLDVPVRQVLIESRIVVADEGFNRDLGVKFGVSVQENVGGNKDFFLGGKSDGDTDFGGNVAFNADPEENFIVDLPIGNPAGSLGLALVDIPNFLIQLELDALETEGRGEVLANPRVITSNQQEAVIEQGTEIPFQEASSSGATSTSFKKAVLSLRVTPQITPDDRVIMDLEVSQDTVGQEFSGIPSIDTRALNTQVLVDDGETVVLGGIYEQNVRDDVEQVPFLGDLPFIGYLFKRTSVVDNKRELLIFVTPKILREALVLN